MNEIKQVSIKITPEDYARRLNTIRPLPPHCKVSKDWAKRGYIASVWDGVCYVVDE